MSFKNKIVRVWNAEILPLTMGEGEVVYKDYS